MEAREKLKLEKLDEDFKQIGQTLGWFDYDTLDDAFKALSTRGKKKKKRHQVALDGDVCKKLDDMESTPAPNPRGDKNVPKTAPSKLKLKKSKKTPIVTQKQSANLISASISTSQSNSDFGKSSSTSTHSNSAYHTVRQPTSSINDISAIADIDETNDVNFIHAENSLTQNEGTFICDSTRIYRNRRSVLSGSIPLSPITNLSFASDSSNNNSYDQLNIPPLSDSIVYQTCLEDIPDKENYSRIHNKKDDTYIGRQLHGTDRTSSTKLAPCAVGIENHKSRKIGGIKQENIGVTSIESGLTGCEKNDNDVELSDGSFMEVMDAVCQTGCRNDMENPCPISCQCFEMSELSRDVETDGEISKKSIDLKDLSDSSGIASESMSYVAQRKLSSRTLSSGDSFVEVINKSVQTDDIGSNNDLVDGIVNDTISYGKNAQNKIEKDTSMDDDVFYEGKTVKKYHNHDMSNLHDRTVDYFDANVISDPSPSAKEKNYSNVSKTDSSESWNYKTVGSEILHDKMVDIDEFADNHDNSMVDSEEMADNHDNSSFNTFHKISIVLPISENFERDPTKSVGNSKHYVDNLIDSFYQHPESAHNDSCVVIDDSNDSNDDDENNSQNDVDQDDNSPNGFIDETFHSVLSRKSTCVSYSSNSNKKLGINEFDTSLNDSLPELVVNRDTLLLKDLEITGESKRDSTLEICENFNSDILMCGIGSINISSIEVGATKSHKTDAAKSHKTDATKSHKSRVKHCTDTKTQDHGKNNNRKSPSSPSEDKNSSINESNKSKDYEIYRDPGKNHKNRKSHSSSSDSSPTNSPKAPSFPKVGGTNTMTPVSTSGTKPRVFDSSDDDAELERFFSKTKSETRSKKDTSPASSKPTSTVLSSDDDDDEALEAFFTKMTPLASRIQAKKPVSDMQDFIVSDNSSDSDLSDDENFSHVAATAKFRTPIMRKPRLPWMDTTSDDDDNGTSLGKTTSPVYLLSDDSDDGVLVMDDNDVVVLDDDVFKTPSTIPTPSRHRRKPSPPPIPRCHTTGWL